MINQHKVIHRGVSIPAPILNVPLHVAPEFTGRVVLYIENGRVKCDVRLSDNEHICSLEGFIELARAAGIRLEEVKDA
ncbi:hypothetical protein ABW11_21190 [Pluralibacter gergoviae]|uniref:hypothetical protein n=1 Tax=Pluralibacter gergoviae TaxID=61647 RepID=UPI000650EB4B|nr:hypothetical protein [Pluralibacter gergoviae]KMK23123.1 hypothetical protein ABW11_21190 [Pluralibacter gergoviae]